MDPVTQKKIESSLLYSAFAAYLLRSTSSKAAAGVYLLATTLFLRPRPEQPDFLKNGIYSLCSLVDGYLFWKVTDQLGQVKEVSTLFRNHWMIAGAVWGVGRAWSLLTKDTPPHSKYTFVSDDVRYSIENNLLYSTFFALALKSPQPTVATALLTLGSTFLFRPEVSGEKGIAAHAGFTLTHLIDGYLFCKVAALSPDSLKQLLTNPWTVGASLWGAGRFFTIFSPRFLEPLDQKLPLNWSVSEYLRARWDLRLKYSFLFILSTQPSYFNRYSIALSVAAPLLLPSNLDGGFVSVIDSVFFWQAVAPLSTIPLEQLSPSVYLWTAGALSWFGLNLCSSLSLSRGSG